MSFIEAVLMGIIQGMTEFLPVSSSGHLAVFKNLFGLSDAGITYDILLHLGTLSAVFICFWDDIRELLINGCEIMKDVTVNLNRFIKYMFGGSRQGEKEYKKIILTSHKRYVILIAVTTFPTGVMGILLKDVIQKASDSLLVPGICLIMTGIILLIADNTYEGRKNEESISYANAWFVGMCQGFAVLPGISRSGATIAACLVAGMDRTFAVKYSFIVSIPAILGAALLDLPDMVKMIPDTGGFSGRYMAGTAVSAAVGYICIKTVLNMVKKKKFKGFAAYCTIIGVISVVVHLINQN